jgi:hypothetical protein
MLGFVGNVCYHSGVVKNTQRTRERLRNLRVLIGGCMAAAGFLLLSALIAFSIFNMPLVIIGLALLILGLIIAASLTVFDIFIQLLGGSR